MGCQAAITQRVTRCAATAPKHRVGDRGMGMENERRCPEDFEALHKSIMKAVEFSEEVQEILYYLYPRVEHCEGILENLSEYVQGFITRLAQRSEPQLERGFLDHPGLGDAPPPDQQRSAGAAEEAFEAYVRRQLGETGWRKGAGLTETQQPEQEEHRQE